MHDGSSFPERVLPSLGMLGLLVLVVAIGSWAVPPLMGRFVDGLTAWSQAVPTWLIGGVFAAVLIGAFVVGFLRPAEPREGPSPRGQRHGALPPPSRVLNQSHVRVITSERPTTTFGDVLGVEEAREELQEVVEFLKCPAEFAAVGARIPRGVLLVGPPGRGKTCWPGRWPARRACRSSRSSGSEFVELYVGVGAARVRTCSRKRASRRRASSSSTRSTRSVAGAAVAWE